MAPKCNLHWSSKLKTSPGCKKLTVLFKKSISGKSSKQNAFPSLKSVFKKLNLIYKNKINYCEKLAYSKKLPIDFLLHSDHSNLLFKFLLLVSITEVLPSIWHFASSSWSAFKLKVLFIKSRKTENFLFSKKDTYVRVRERL